MPTTKSQLKAGLKVTDLQTQDSGLSSNQDVQRQQIADRANAAVKAPTGTITSETLSGNAKPLKLPPPTVQTLTTGTQEYIASQNNTIKSEAQRQLDIEKRQLDNQRNDITSLITDLGNSGQMKNDLYKSEGVDKAKKEVDEYTSQLEAEQLSNTRRIQAIQKNPQGLFAGGMEQEVNRVNTESVSKQADLAILQNASLRKYSTAAEIADRQLAAKMDQQKSQLEALQFFYSENKADFNKKDDRAYAELIDAKEKAYQKELARETANTNILKEAIGTGAPPEVLANVQRLIREGASDVDVAMAAGQYSSLGRQTYESDRTFKNQNGWKLQNIQNADGTTTSSWVNESTRQVVPVGSQASAAPSIASVYPDGSTGPGTGNLAGQCGAFINATVDLPTPNDTVGMSLKDKMANVQKYGVDAQTYAQEGARVGDVLFFNIGSVGHVAAVNTVNPDGTVTVSESNLNLDGKVRNNRIVDLNNKTIIGAIRGNFKNGIEVSQPQTPVNDYGKGLQFIKDNPGASRQELEATIRQNLPKLQESEITSLLGQKKITKAEIESSANQKQAQDALKETYTTDELFKLAKDNGYASFWTGKESDINRFLNSSKARELYIDLIYNQYKASGMAE